MPALSNKVQACPFHSINYCNTIFNHFGAIGTNYHNTSTAAQCFPCPRWRREKQLNTFFATVRADMITYIYLVGHSVHTWQYIIPNGSALLFEFRLHTIKPINDSITRGAIVNLLLRCIKKIAQILNAGNSNITGAIKRLLQSTWASNINHKLQMTRSAAVKNSDVRDFFICSIFM